MIRKIYGEVPKILFHFMIYIYYFLKKDLAKFQFDPFPGFVRNIA